MWLLLIFFSCVIHAGASMAVFDKFNEIKADKPTTSTKCPFLSKNSETSMQKNEKFLKDHRFPIFTETQLKGLDTIDYRNHHTVNQTISQPTLPAVAKIDSRTYNTIFLSKFGVIFMLIAVSLIGAAIPHYISKSPNVDNVMPFINCAAAGTFFCIALLHLLPESIQQNNHADFFFRVALRKIDVTYVVTVLGFIIMLLIDRVLFPENTEAGEVFKHSHFHCNKTGISGSRGSSDISENGPRNSAVSEGQEIFLDSRSVPRNTETDEVLLFLHVNRNSAGDEYHRNCEENGKISRFSASTFMSSAGIAIHAISEGLVVGFMNNARAMWVTSLMIAGHKWAETFSISANCSRKNLNKRLTFINLGIVIFGSPIGILSGFIIHGMSTNLKFSAFVSSLVVGFILYSACEIIFEEFGSSRKIFDELIKFGCFCFGGGIIFLLMIFHAGEHHHCHH